MSKLPILLFCVFAWGGAVGTSITVTSTTNDRPSICPNPNKDCDAWARSVRYHDMPAQEPWDGFKASSCMELGKKIYGCDGTGTFYNYRLTAETFCGFRHYAFLGRVIGGLFYYRRFGDYCPETCQRPEKLPGCATNNTANKMAASSSAITTTTLCPPNKDCDAWVRTAGHHGFTASSCMELGKVIYGCDGTGTFHNYRLGAQNFCGFRHYTFSGSFGDHCPETCQHPEKLPGCATTTTGITTTTTTATSATTTITITTTGITANSDTTPCPKPSLRSEKLRGCQTKPTDIPATDSTIGWRSSVVSVIKKSIRLLSLMS